MHAVALVRSYLVQKTLIVVDANSRYHLRGYPNSLASSGSFRGLLLFLSSLPSYRITTSFFSMVRVWYEPPPYGYGTDLMNAPYGVHGAGAYKSVRNLVERLSRMKQSYVMIPSVALICALCYIPSSKC